MNFDFVTRDFGAIAKNMNLSRAARELNTTQTALTKRLESAERELGVRLIVRSQGGEGLVRLTPQGRALLKTGLTMNHAWTQFADELGRLRHTGPEILVGSSYTDSFLATVAALRAQLTASWPTDDGGAPTLIWCNTYSTNSFDAVRSRRIDLCFEPASAMADTHDLASIPLFTDPGVLIVGDANPLLERRTGLGLGDVSDTPLLSLANQSAYPARKHLHTLCGELGFTPFFRMCDCDSETVMLAEHLGEEGAAYFCPASHARQLVAAVPGTAVVTLVGADFDMRAFRRDEHDATLERVVTCLAKCCQEVGAGTEA